MAFWTVSPKFFEEGVSPWARYVRTAKPVLASGLLVPDFVGQLPSALCVALSHHRTLSTAASVLASP